MTRYRPLYNCKICGHRWKGDPVRTTEGRSPEEDAAYRMAYNGTPPCPNLNCGALQVPHGIDLSLNKAPATIGASLQVKAIDETAKIVMEDYGMGDLRTDVRQGETAAPRLAPALQRQADNFFLGRKRHPDLPQRPSMNPAFLGRAAISGAYRQPQGYQPVEQLHSMDPDAREAIRPPVRIVADTNRRQG